MFFSNLKTHYLRITCTILAAAFIGLTTPACGGDDDEPEPNKTEKPDEPDTPGTPETPDTPDEPVTPEIKPTAEDFQGNWKCVWYKYVQHVLVEDIGWRVSSSEYTEAEIAGSSSLLWCSSIWLTNHNDHNYLFFRMNSEEVNTLFNLIDSKGTGKVSIGLNEVRVTDGNLDGDYYRWEWNESTSTIMLYNGTKVRYRWKVTKFDGDTFEACEIRNPNYTPGMSDLYSDDYFRFKRAAN